jgi:hypothetical protein
MDRLVRSSNTIMRTCTIATRTSIRMATIINTRITRSNNTTTSLALPSRPR